MRFLFCTDGSSYSEDAIRFGGKIAKALGASATVFSVSPVLEYEPSIFRHADEIDIKQVKEIVAKIGGEKKASEKGKAILEEMGVKAEAKTAEGIPADEILKEAATGYDAVVLAARSKKGEIVSLLGSVSTKVVHLAKIPVIVV